MPTKRNSSTATFTAQALKAEQGRRKNNKSRRKAGEKPVNAASWVLPGMSGADLKTVLAGEAVKVAFKTRDVTVTLKG